MYGHHFPSFARQFPTPTARLRKLHLRLAASDQPEWSVNGGYVSYVKLNNLLELSLRLRIQSDTDYQTFWVEGILSHVVPYTKIKAENLRVDVRFEEPRLFEDLPENPEELKKFLQHVRDRLVALFQRDAPALKLGPPPPLKPHLAAQQKETVLEREERTSCLIMPF
ncbi:hypothetical protein UCRPC4_g03371 [Phaeomoniella chlamydospora]|uniref:Uncharacterized protein n=1 Tax=Phaeomoniella chlamydospora TaxID=158046 RepID=A0A0G2GEY8_PHACM|nr:hypothetical protein UCRPC4_g03371 [Phaeomoniella chlamydospora]